MNYLEKEILGCILKDNTLINETILQVSHFESQASQLIYQSMILLSAEGKAIDQVTLLAENYDYLESLGGIDFITDLKSKGDIDHFDSYEKQLIENYKARESQNIVANWLSAKDKNNDDLILKLQKIEDESISDVENIKTVIQEISNLPNIEGVDAGIPTGFKALDDITGGFQKESSYIMGARPSMGKTATMLHFGLSAMKSGAVPLIFSLEMSKEQLLMRYFATIGNINLFLARNPHRLMASQKKSWEEAGNQLQQYDFEIYDEPMQTIQYIRSQVRKAKRKHEGKEIIVFIDYLTLINSAGTYHSDHAKFTDISARIKALAKEYKCPVITLAQLSRGVEQRQNKRPMLSDLRESGSIEQDADCVMFLYRESYYNKEIDDNELEIIVAKHRNGPTGDCKVFYNRATGKMGDLSDY